MKFYVYEMPTRKEKAASTRHLKAKMKSALREAEWDIKGVSKARIAGILKGIAVDKMITSGEAPYWIAAQKRLPGLASRLRAGIKEKRQPAILDNDNGLTDEHQNKLNRYREEQLQRRTMAANAKAKAIANVRAKSKVKARKALRSARKAGKVAIDSDTEFFDMGGDPMPEPIPEPVARPARRRRRADADVIAAAGTGFKRTRSGREH